MAEDHGGHEGLSKIFNMHTLHWAMIGGMALGAIALTGGLAGAATLPDLGVAVLDSGWQMLSGLEHTVSVGGDVISNTLSGDFGLNYEWGSAAHGGAEAAAHTAHTAGAESLAGGFDAAAGCTAEGFNDFILENSEMGMLDTLATENSGDLIGAYESGGYCHTGHG